MGLQFCRLGIHAGHGGDSLSVLQNLWGLILRASNTWGSSTWGHRCGASVLAINCVPLVFSARPFHVASWGFPRAWWSQDAGRGGQCSTDKTPLQVPVKLLLAACLKQPPGQSKMHSQVHSQHRRLYRDQKVGVTGNHPCNNLHGLM